LRTQLSGKRFLIAGAGGLLGTRIIAGLLDQGAAVVAADLDVNATKSRLTELGIAARPEQIGIIELDIADEESVKRAFYNIGIIDGAVNTTYPRNKNYGRSFFDVTLKDFNENLAMNLGGSFLFLQQCANYFNKSLIPFSLVNISSVYGVKAPDFSIYDNTSMTMPVEYAAIKSALIHLGKYTSAYVGNSDFRVNSVSPGGILDSQPESFLSSYKRKTHGTGMLAAEDIVGAVLFLLSDQSRYIVGQNITVDDGFTL